MQSLETAAFSAWPALETEDFKGWSLRLDRGYTKRANSANSSVQAQVLSATDIDYIDRRFQSHGLSPIFRLTSNAPVAETDALLIERGYRFVDLSLVMTAPLSSAPASSSLALAADPATWLAGFQAASGKSGADQAMHLDILRRIKDACAFAMKSENGSPLCCGLGVVVGDKLGLFDIATHPAHRGRGLAKALCRELMSWGYGLGARTAFLQVVGSNTSAIGLYERLGFRYAYHYWYRVVA
jgi:ribosomal protein S18 acetylase RimI-like enzyme